MSNDWITGEKSRTDRIKNAVGDNEKLAKEIRDAFKRGEVKKLLVIVAPN
jgi:hypothetical protein